MHAKFLSCTSLWLEQLSSRVPEFPDTMAHADLMHNLSTANDITNFKIKAQHHSKG